MERRPTMTIVDNLQRNLIGEWTSTGTDVAYEPGSAGL